MIRSRRILALTVFAALTAVTSTAHAATMAGAVTLTQAGAAPATTTVTPGEVCMFSAPNVLDFVGLIGHDAWGFEIPGQTTSDGSVLWEWGSYGALSSGSTRPWTGSGSFADMYSTFLNYGGGGKYTAYRCTGTPDSNPTAAGNTATQQNGIGYNLLNHNCLTVAVMIYKSYDASLANLPDGANSLPNDYFNNTLNNYAGWSGVRGLNQPVTLTFRSAPGYGNGDYVSSEMGYTGGSYAMLRARATTQGLWESWTEYRLGADLIALRSDSNGRFVSAELGYTETDQGELRARSSVIGPWEEFHLVSNADGTYSLYSNANGLYVSAEFGYTGGNYAELRARAASIGPWEKFTTSTVSAPPPCVDYGGTTITGPDSCAGTFTIANAWFSGGGVGLQGQEIWTYANGTVTDSAATYELSGLGTGNVYDLYAYIPNAHSDASNAHYRYCNIDSSTGSSVCNDGYVNQNNYTNQWALFGAVCTADGKVTITLADDGGDVYPAEVGADAIRATGTSISC